MEKSDKNRHKIQVSSIKTDNSSGKYLHYLILAGIIILTLIIYSGTFKNGFTNWDDNVNITDNKNIQNLSFSIIVKMFSFFNYGVYQPLSTLSYPLIYNFFGLNPTAFHSVSILFHLLNVILVYLFVYELTRHKEQDTRSKTEENKFRSRVQTATFVALFFAIHPMHTESVCWISALCDVQYSFYYLASLIFYLKYLQKSKVKSQKSKVSFNYLFSILLFILSLLSKPMAVTLPVILILLDYYVNSIKTQVSSIKTQVLSVKYWMDKIPFFLLAIVFGIITIISQKFTDTTNNNMIQYSLINRFFLLTYSVSFYIINLIAPIKLSALHPSPELIQGFLPLKYYLSPLLIISIIVVIIKTQVSRHKTEDTKYIIFGTLFFLITISVALIAGRVRHAEVAERYTYIPYLGLFFIIGRYIMNNEQRMMNNLKFLVVIVFMLIFSVISYQRNKVWANSLSLYNDVVKKYPRAYLAFYNRGVAKDALGDKRGAIEDYTKAIENNPKDAEAFNNRGVAKKNLSNFEGAIQDYNRAIRLNPEYAEAFNNRGNAKLSLGDKQGAIKDYNKAIESNPLFAAAFNNRGIVKGELGDKQGAIDDFNKAIEINPQFAGAFHNKGNKKTDIDDKQGGIQDYNKAIELNPQNAEAFNNNGIVKDERGDHKGAIDDFNKVIELNPQFAEAFYNRGIAKNAIGDYKGAIQDYSRTIELNPQYALAYNNRGNAKAALGDKQGACSDWSKAVEHGFMEANENIKKYCH